MRDQFRVPMHKMMSEVGVSSGERTGAILGGRRRIDRADILVYDRESNPLMVVECKRPELELTREVLEQALRYATLFRGVRYLAVTNGRSTYFAAGRDGRLEFTDKVPVYTEMF